MNFSLYILYNYSLNIGRHLNYFQLKATRHNDTMNILEHVFWCTYACISVGYKSGSRSTGQGCHHRHAICIIAQGPVLTQFLCLV